ncbi:LLM class flavin-dependent oxidoreductase [Chthonobacter rhizosphaerae]|uniref:LLM class flavin-dependent oxidoreductase n=1 Tax=Chthonobacter rhizosphaerae TaxID=2735553 RepID=UPI0015EF009A|nr:LLM class flavin-dependent oxidoreductase [Chthonobacter rhizosphaerae]
MQLGLWLPVYGGWLRSAGFMHAPSAAECLEAGVLAERLGLSLVYASENFLNCVQGPNTPVVDAWTLLAALAARTERIQLVGGLKPSFRPAAVAAQMLRTLGALAPGRVAPNVVCGWWREEFDACGVTWQPHEEKYAVAADYLADVRRLVGSGLATPFVSGHSDPAFRLAADTGATLFLNGMPPEAVADVRHRFARLTSSRAKPRIAVNALILPADTDMAGEDRRRAIADGADAALISLFKSAILTSGAQSWGVPSDADLIDTNGAFTTALAGAPDTIADRLSAYAEAGVDLVLCQFPDTLRDLAAFGSTVMPLLDRPVMPAPRSGDVP